MTLEDIDFCNVWARVVQFPVQEPCRSACVVRRRCVVKLSLVPARSAPSMRPLRFGAVPASSLRSLCGVAGGTMFHMSLFGAHPAPVCSDVLVFYIDFETSGLDVLVVRPPAGQKLI